MKKIVTNTGEFGVYESIKKTSSHWECDGAILPFTIVSADGTVEEAEVVVRTHVEVPMQITPRQIRQQLTAIRLRKTVEDLISSSDDYDLKDWWNHSQDFQRSHPVLKEMGEKLGLTSEQLDEMFIEASKL